MADPTIQTFCCHHANGTDMAVTVIQEFNTEAYNIVCIFSSCLGILGAIYQILPRQEFSNRHRWFSLSATRGRKIIVWLAVADLLASVGVFVRSTIWINYKNIMPNLDDSSSVVFCAISSAFVQYFYTATWLWTLIYAIDMRLILRERSPKTVTYHTLAWILPAISTLTGLLLLYLPDANCHTTMSLESVILRILPNYIATYIPIAMVMILNPCLYKKSTTDMERIITSASGQFTTREREILDSIKIKFSVINCVFYLCWIPNLINGILCWTLWFELPTDWIVTIWYIMAFMNPLQALFNCLVYRRWSVGSEKIVMPWRRNQFEEQSYGNIYTESVPGSVESSVREEILPLLQNAQSVNGYRCFR